MRKKFFFISMLFIINIFILTSCGAQPQANEKTNYEETKKMVVDILKTDDGKKAIQEALKDEEMQQSLIMDQKIVTETIQNSLTSDQGSKTLQKLFNDPKFLENYAKNLRNEHHEIIKGLMKDPDYQKMLMEIFQDPEMQKSMQTIVKSQEIRKHLQEVILETLESPLYKAKIEEAILKAAKEAMQKTAESSGGEQKEEKTDSTGH